MPKYLGPPPPPDWVDDTMPEIKLPIKLDDFIEIMRGVPNRKTEEKILINHSSNNTPIELGKFIGVMQKNSFPFTEKSIGTFRLMCRHPDTGELYFVSKIAIDKENKNIIISQH